MTRNACLRALVNSMVNHSLNQMNHTGVVLMKDVKHAMAVDVEDVAAFLKR